MRTKRFAVKAVRAGNVLLAVVAVVGTLMLGACGAPHANGDYLVWSQERSLRNYNHVTYKSYNINASAYLNGKFGSTYVSRSHGHWGGWNGYNNCDY